MTKIQFVDKSNKLRSTYFNLATFVISSGLLLGFCQQNSGVNGFVLQELPLYRRVLDNYLQRQQREILLRTNSKNSAFAKNSPILEMNMVRKLRH